MAKSTRKIRVQSTDVKVLSWDGVEKALAEIAIAKQKIVSEQATYNEQEQTRRARLTEKHAPLQESIKERERAITEFRKTHRDDFGTQKTRELQHGLASFRLGTPKVEKYGARVWDDVLKLVRASDNAQTLIRVKEELDKEEVLAQHALFKRSSGKFGLSDEQLSAIGMRVVQEEMFHYELKLATEAK